MTIAFDTDVFNFLCEANTIGYDPGRDTAR